MDCLTRIWDLRSGKSIMALKGHIKNVLTLDWSPNGHHLATGSEDHTIRIWDIRSIASIYTVPAHKSIVSQVKYFKAGDTFESGIPDVEYSFHGASTSHMEVDKRVVTTDNHQEIKRQVLNGSFLVSSSYDGTCKVWTDGDFKPLKSLTGLEGKITCCDISGDAKYIATTLYDRTFKLFAPSGVNILEEKSEFDFSKTQ